MSAVSNLTYVYVRDNLTSSTRPTGDSVLTFVNYDEAMSWAKWLVKFVPDGEVFIWNYNGNSGNWFSSGGTPTFVVQPNTNWP